MISKLLIVAGSLLVITACSETTDTSSNIGEKSVDVNKPAAFSRWYSDRQVKKGRHIFQTHCASCHQADASGTQNWREKDVSGNYPPPPLNGTAHAWHHPLRSLKRTVQAGGVLLGGTMPAFSEKLNDREIEDVLAWVQSHWSDEIYSMWSQRNDQTSK
ncbi:MAG: cytochrome c [Gammaproteobacteria bacterium]|nr:cytochrome c [Gammaproteobacteria bacterium]